MTILVRPYSARDTSFVRNLFERSTLELRRRAPFLAIPNNFVDRYLPPTIRAARRRPGLLRVAEVDGQRAGFVLVLKKKAPAPWDETRTGAALVMELHVHPTFQKRGVGRRLLMDAEAHYRNQGFDWMTLGVFSRNTGARAFYSRVGYRDAYLFLGKRLASGGRGAGQSHRRAHRRSP